MAIRPPSHRVLGLGLALVAALALAAAAGLPRLPAVPKVPEVPKPAVAPGGAADPKAWLGRADELLAHLEGATSCLESSRAALFGLAATSEEKRLLKDLEQAADSSAEDLSLRRRQYQAEVVEQARRERRFEAARLTGEQAANMGRLGSNLLLAVRRDQVAVEAGRRLLGDADDVLRAARDPVGAARLGAGAGRVVAMPARLKEALGMVPGQLDALQALLEAVEQTRAHNPVRLAPPPETGGDYQPVEDF